MTFRNVYYEWFLMKCRTKRKTTADRIEITYNRYFAHSDFVDMEIARITEPGMIEFLQRIIVGLGSITQKEFSRILQILRGVLVYARDMRMEGSQLYDWDMIRRNLSEDKILNIKKQEKALSETVVNTLLHNVLEEKIYPEKHAACLCLCMNFYLGLRIGELSALKFTDFDLEKQLLYVSRSDIKCYERDENGNKIQMNYTQSLGKTENANRIIPLVPEALHIYGLLKDYHKARGFHSAFCVYDGSDCIRLRSLDRTLKRLCVLSGVEPFNSHLIRKTFATDLHHAGAVGKVITDLVGHSDISTTEKYYVLSREDQVDKYRKLMRESFHYKLKQE